MNLGQAKDKAIKLLDEYSMQGQVVDPILIEDYKLRMTQLANDAQIDINIVAKVESKIPDIFTQAQVTDGIYNLVEHMLPMDFKEIKAVYLNNYPFVFCRLSEGMVSKNFIYNNIYSGTFKIYYYKKINEVVLDTDDFEIDTEFQTAIPYYMAGMVIAPEKPRLSTQIMTMYNTRMQQFLFAVKEREKMSEDNTFRTVINVTGW